MLSTFYNARPLVVLMVLVVPLFALSCTSADTGSSEETSGVPEAEVETINADSFYPEGPLWLQDELFYTEYSEHRILTYDGESNSEFWTEDGCGPSGLIETAESELLVTCYDSNTLAVVDEDGKTTATIDSDSDGNPLKGPNDFAEDSRGGIYFSASGTYAADAPAQGKIYYMSPSNGNPTDKREIREVASGLHYSNGLGITPDGSTLFAADMLERRILAFDVGEDGSLSNKRTFADTEELSPTPGGPEPLDGPDGLKVSESGQVYIAQNGTGRVLIVSPDGTLMREIDVPAEHVTNVGFGPTPQTLYVTSAKDPNNQPYPGEVYKVVP